MKGLSQLVVNRKSVGFYCILSLVIVLLSKSISAQGNWGPPTNLGGNVNTAMSEVSSSISADSSKLYFTSDRSGGYGLYDIWVSVNSNGWQTPTNLGANINGIDYDCMPCISGDGAKLYFSSNRSGGYGSFDIYVSEYSGGIWQPPTNLGSNVNSSDMEFCPSVSADGSRLYFESSISGGQGLTDIWMSSYSGGSWQPAVNLGDSINTYTYESEPKESYDGQILYFSSCRNGGYGDYDIWQSARVSNVWQSPTNLGSNINTSGYESGPDISSNSMKLYFTAFNLNGGYGEYDIWVSVKQGAVEEQSSGYRISERPRLPTIISGTIRVPSGCQYDVLDVCGRRMNPTRLSPGVYFVAIDGKIIEKVVKVH